MTPAEKRRDMFAAVALPALLVDRDISLHKTRLEIVKECVIVADALIAELDATRNATRPK